MHHNFKHVNIFIHLTTKILKKNICVKMYSTLFQACQCFYTLTNTNNTPQRNLNKYFLLITANFTITFSLLLTKEISTT